MQQITYHIAVVFRKIKKSDSAGIIGPVRIVTAGEIRRRAERKRLQEKKRGYCECCQIKYENLDKVKIIIIILFNVVGFCLGELQ